MKRSFVTVVSGKHMDWKAADWKKAWVGIIKKIGDNIGMDNHELLFLNGIHFVDWTFWLGCDPAVDDDSAKVLILEKEWSSHCCNYPMSAVKIARLEFQKECEAKDQKLQRKLSEQYGVNTEDIIIKDGKIFLYAPVLSSMIDGLR